MAVFLVALAARAAFGLVRGGGLTYDDEQWYWELSRSYLSGASFVGEFGHRAERMPLYPWLLSFFSNVQQARAAQWLIGALGAALVCLLARETRTAGGIAGLFIALDPALVGSSSLLLSETLAVTALAGLWLAAWPLLERRRSSAGRWCIVALVACVCVHARESLLIFVVGLVLLLAAVRRDWRGVCGGCGVLLVLVASLLPWALRNAGVVGKTYWLTSRAGISLYDGVRPGATGASDLAEIKDNPAVEDLSEAEWDAYFRDASWRAIRENPLRIVGLVPVKLARTWSPVLNAAEYASWPVRLIFAGWYVPLYALIVLGVWSRRREAATLAGLLLPALCVSGLHSVFVGSVRYRLVALPALAVLAALGLMWLAASVSRRRAAETIS